MKILTIVSVIFALIAAGLWAWSAFINVPIIYSGYGSIGTQMPNGQTEIGVEPFYAALKMISKLNAGAAGCAFISALAQAVTLFLKN